MEQEWNENGTRLEREQNEKGTRKDRGRPANHGGAETGRAKRRGMGQTARNESGARSQARPPIPWRTTGRHFRAELRHIRIRRRLDGGDLCDRRYVASAAPPKAGRRAGLGGAGRGRADPADSAVTRSSHGAPRHVTRRSAGPLGHAAAGHAPTLHRSRLSFQRERCVEH